MDCSKKRERIPKEAAFSHFLAFALAFRAPPPESISSREPKFCGIPLGGAQYAGGLGKLRGPVKSALRG